MLGHLRGLLKVSPEIWAVRPAWPVAGRLQDPLMPNLQAAGLLFPLPFRVVQRGTRRGSYILLPVRTPAPFRTAGVAPSPLPPDVAALDPSVQPFHYQQIRRPHLLQGKPADVPAFRSLLPLPLPFLVHTFACLEQGSASRHSAGLRALAIPFSQHPLVPSLPVQARPAMPAGTYHPLRPSAPTPRLGLMGACQRE